MSLRKYTVLRGVKTMVSIWVNLMIERKVRINLDQSLGSDQENLPLTPPEIEPWPFCLSAKRINRSVGEIDGPL